jgi:phosphoglycerol transferase MdoB-like AlkP superfamily enzyme
MQHSYSNYEKITDNNIRLELGEPLQFSFEAKKTKLASFDIYKDMKMTRLSSSDKASVTITNNRDDIIFSTQVFLYHQSRNYISVPCGELALEKGEKYTVTIEIVHFDDQSFFYLSSHEKNTFDEFAIETARGDIPVGLSRAPNVSYTYHVLSISQMIPHFLFYLLFIVILFLPKIMEKRWVKEVYRGVFICTFIYLILEVLNVAKPSPMQLFFPLTLQHYFILLSGLLILVLLYLCLYAISGNGTVAIFLAGGLAIIVGYVNHGKIVMRGDPAMPWDLFSAGIAAKISSKYEFAITMRLIVSIIMILFLLFVIRLAHTPTIHGFKKRLTAVFLSLLVMIGFMFGDVLNKDLLKKLDISYSLYPPLQSYNENGTLFALMLHLNNVTAAGGDNNSQEATEDIIDKYVAIAQQRGLLEQSPDATAEKPNVICIMSESFSDLSEIRTIETSEEVMPFYDSLKEESLYGELQVSVFGGGTCNTEFEFLTGYAPRSLLAGSSVYSLYVNHPLNALPQIYKDQGYSTLAIHPFDSVWWNREDAYPLLGFDSFISDDDFVDPEIIRYYISDKSAFERVITEYEAKDPEKPMFTFLVTMQNHADYAKYWEDFTYNIKITNFPGKDFPTTEHYLSLIRESDDALKNLVTYFEAVDEPTIIVFFGDHKPFLDTDLYSTLLSTDLSQISARESLPMYTTPYLIWANYDMPIGDAGITSPNFLGQTVLDLSGLRSPDERACLRVLMSEISAMSALAIFDKDETAYTNVDTLPEAIQDTLTDYEFIQYGKIYLEESIIDNDSGG